MHIPDWLLRRASLSPDSLALVDRVRGGGAVSYRA
jgi:hypothetical protein